MVKAIFYVIWATVNAITIVAYMGSIFLFVVYSMDAVLQATARR